MSPVRVDALRALATTLLVGSVCLGPSPARGQADPAQQRARIAADRAQADAVLADRDRACLPQFVVAPCRAAARNEQRATLTRLRREETALDEAERNANAARRREALADKAAARQARSAAVDASAAQRAQAPAVAPGIEPAASAAKERVERSSGARRAPRAPRAPPKTTRPAPGHADHAGRRSALEAKNIAAFEARARAAQAHRDAVASRTARRLQGSEGDQGVNAVRRSAPLPTPPTLAVPVAGVVAGAVAGAGASASVAASRPAR